MPATILRGQADAALDQLVGALDAYASDHPTAKIDLYRQNSVSVRVRVIDPDFARLDRPQRSRQVWEYLARLPEEVQSDISTVLLLTPTEAEQSFANFEFDSPTPSDL